METLWQDLKYGARMLAKNPGFTIAAVLTLALGIGANTAIFSYINGVFLRPLPVPEPDRLVRVYGNPQGGRRFDIFSHANFTDLCQRNLSFTEMAAHQRVAVSLSTGGEGENISGELVSGSYFSVLGVKPQLGRVLLPSDDETVGAHPVAVISDTLWKRLFGASPGAVGQTLHINGYAFSVVGVAPAGYQGTYDAFRSDFWAPIAMYEQVRPRGIPLTNRNWGWLFATARLKPGVTLEQAQQDVARVAAQLEQEYPTSNRGYRYNLFPASALPESYREGATKFLGGFLVVVGLVLLVACANVAGMLLARISGRRREIAVRLSLGATRARLVGQLLTESLLLSALAGVVALFIAVWMADLLLLLRPATPEWTSFAPRISLDARVLVFTFAAAVLTGVMIGLLPALRAGRTELVGVLKEESAMGSLRRSRLHGAFVVGQVALSVIVLAGAGLLLRTLREVEAFNPGFDTRNLELAAYDLRRFGYDEARGQVFYRQLLERLRTQPEIAAATVARVVPLGGDEENIGIRLPGHVQPDGSRNFSVDFNVVGPEYLATMRIPLVSGREFNTRDLEPGAPPVAFINETMARQFWPAGDAVGRSFELIGGPQVQIIGVVRDVKYYSLAEPPRPYLYAPLNQFPSRDMIVHLRARGGPAAALAALRREVEALNPKVARIAAGTFSELRRISLYPTVALATVTSAFGALALLLTAIGLYGLMAYSVAQRTREFGIRVALGAKPGDVFRLVVRQGMLLMGAGVLLGVGGGLAALRFLETLLFNVSASDPVTFVSVAALLVVVALMACWIPARRAMRVEPMEALRYE